MKYAIIADIHGNYPALAAVLQDAKEQGAEGYIFAGDYCLSGPYPNECLAAIRELPNTCIVRGNEESYLERLKGTDQANWTDGQMQISYYAYRTVTEENREYLETLPRRIDFTCNGTEESPIKTNSIEYTKKEQVQSENSSPLKNILTIS